MVLFLKKDIFFTNTYLGTLPARWRRRRWRCSPGCSCPPRLQTRSANQRHFFSGSSSVVFRFIVTLNGSIDEIGACAMYQLFPASPLRPQTLRSSPDTRTYTFWLKKETKGNKVSKICGKVTILFTHQVPHSAPVHVGPEPAWNRQGFLIRTKNPFRAMEGNKPRCLIKEESFSFLFFFCLPGEENKSSVAWLKGENRQKKWFFWQGREDVKKCSILYFFAFPSFYFCFSFLSSPSLFRTDGMIFTNFLDL